MSSAARTKGRSLRDSWGFLVLLLAEKLNGYLLDVAASHGCVVLLADGRIVETASSGGVYVNFLESRWGSTQGQEL